MEKEKEAYNRWMSRPHYSDKERLFLEYVQQYSDVDDKSILFYAGHHSRDEEFATLKEEIKIHKEGAQIVENEYNKALDKIVVLKDMIKRKDEALEDIVRFLDELKHHGIDNWSGEDKVRQALQYKEIG